MYHAIVARVARTNFDRVNRKRYDAILAGCGPAIRHEFGGAHALGGVRHGREAVRAWFERLGRTMPTLCLAVRDVWVTGLPNRTTIVVRWDATATLLDGSPYRNRGVHVLEMRWFKVTDIDAHEDSLAVADALRVQAACGLDEAAAAQIVS